MGLFIHCILGEYHIVSLAQNLTQHVVTRPRFTEWSLFNWLPNQAGLLQSVEGTSTGLSRQTCRSREDPNPIYIYIVTYRYRWTPHRRLGFIMSRPEHQAPPEVVCSTLLIRCASGGDHTTCDNVSGYIHFWEVGERSGRRFIWIWVVGDACKERREKLLV